MAEMEYAIKRAGVILNADKSGMLDVAAMEVERAARANAMKKGGRSFWVRQIADSLHTETVGEARVVGSTHVAAAHKQFGGTVSAPGKGEGSLHRAALTIPVGIARENRWDTDKAQAAGWRLFRVKGKDGRGLLFGERVSGSKRKRRRQELLFVLRKSVEQKPDKWFPEGAQLEAAVSRGIDLYLRTRGGENG